MAVEKELNVENELNVEVAENEEVVVIALIVETAEIVVVVESMQSEDDMRALFHQEVKPRLAKRPQVGAYNQEI